MGRDQGKDRSWKERGQGMVLAALGLAVLLGFVAMAVDIGLFLHERRQLQNAADAAALAGASELPLDPLGALAEAENWAEKNGINTDDDDDDGDDDDELESIEVSTTNFPADTIRVTVKRDVSFLFARVLGISGGSVKASATAMIGSPVGIGGLAPFAVLEEVFLGLNPGDTTTLKYNATKVEDGNFLPLGLDSPGGNEFEQNVKTGSDAWLCAQGYEEANCPSTAVTETGNLVGPTEKALDWIIANTSTACDTFDEVFSGPDALGLYIMDPDCNRFVDPSVASYRVIVVPIIDALCNGKCTVNVLKFALFFIESYTCGGKGGKGNTCDLVGRYVEANVDAGAYIGPFDPLGSFTFVRLIE